MSAGGGGAVETRFVYDAAGRRVREERADGGVRVFAWGALARLESVSIDGALEKRRVSLLTDALGELTAVDGAYSWAGNNPVGMSDPSGRHPLTDAEFASWRDSHRTGLAAAGDRVAACDPVTGEALARTVTATAPTGRTQRVYSFEVDGLQGLAPDLLGGLAARRGGAPAGEGDRPDRGLPAHRAPVDRPLAVLLLGDADAPRH